MCMYFILSSDVKVPLSAAHNAIFCSNELIFFSICCCFNLLLWNKTFGVKDYPCSLSVYSFLIEHDGEATANCPCVVNFSDLFQGFFETGDRMLQRERLRKAGTHHLWIGITTHLFIWLMDEKGGKRGKNKCQIKPTGRQFFLYVNLTWYLIEYSIQGAMAEMMGFNWLTERFI